MQPNGPTATDILSPTLSFPNDEAETHLSQLVGLDGHIKSLCRDLSIIFDPGLVEAWSEKHYDMVLPAVRLLQDAVPLIVFEGDVGAGKTALADVIGQRVAVERGYGVHLVKMSTQVRGAGYVGQMGTLLAKSFKHVANVWGKHGEPVIFVIDEADSLLTTRASQQQHHEDKSGVNTILQHLDQLRRSAKQIAVIAITNRAGVIDPAVRRRATAVLSFSRPNNAQCKELLERIFDGAFLSQSEVDVLVEASQRGTRQGNLTYSDLVLRFAIPALREAVGQDHALDASMLAETLRHLKPTPAMYLPETQG